MARPSFPERVAGGFGDFAPGQLASLWPAGQNSRPEVLQCAHGRQFQQTEQTVLVTAKVDGRWQRGSRPSAASGMANGSRSSAVVGARTTLRPGQDAWGAGLGRTMLASSASLAWVASAIRSQNGGCPA